MRRFAVGAALLATACAAAPKSADAGMKIHDVCPRFFAFWDECRDMDPRTKAERFKAEVVPEFPAFYAHRFEEWRGRGKDPDAELATELSRPAELVERMRTVRDRIAAGLPRDLAAFRAALPDLRDDVEVHVLHSLGECDGGVRVLDGKPTFLVGVDVIARLHATADDTPFLHHELFHLYHLQWFEPGREAGSPEHVVYTSVWMEGLATYASHVLNPDAGPDALLLDTPAGMWSACESRRAELASRLLADFRSESADVYRRWFNSGDAPPDAPPRAAYYLGYLALRRIGATRTLAEMARLSESEFEPLLEAALVEIRDGM